MSAPPASDSSHGSPTVEDKAIIATSFRQSALIESQMSTFSYFTQSVTSKFALPPAETGTLVSHDNILSSAYGEIFCAVLYFALL